MLSLFKKIDEKMTKTKDSSNEKKTIYKSEKKIVTLLFLMVVFLLGALIFTIEVFKYNYTYEDFVKSIGGTILGTMFSILVIDILYELLIQKYNTEEIKLHILSVLFGDSKTIKLLDRTQREEFIKKIISTLVEDEIAPKEKASLINGILSAYIDRQYNITMKFDYTITLEEKWSRGVFDDSYIQIHEELDYTRVFMGESSLAQDFKIKFLVSDNDLYRELRDDNTFFFTDSSEKVFNERLIINPKDLDTLIAFSKDDQKEFVKNNMALVVFINSKKAEIKDVDVDSKSIIVKLHSMHDTSIKELHVYITFYIPQLQKSKFLASLIDPTDSPLIKFKYPAEYMNVTIHPFINDGDTHCENCSTPSSIFKSEGLYTINIRNNWTHPYSGILFLIEPNNNKLTDLTISSGTLTPAFDSTIRFYNAHVSNDVSSITITPTIKDNTTTIKINNVPVNSGNACSNCLDVGPNTINVVLTDQNGTSKTYTIKVIRDSATSS
jgi:hypothetical protein